MNTPAYDSPRRPGAAGLEAGAKLGGGRYRLVKLLGQGGMGMVWLAFDERLGERVALKLLPMEIRADAVALDDLRRETARSHRLAHPNIVRIHDLHEVEGEPAFISMEYVDGPNLSEWRLQQPDRVLRWTVLRPLVEHLCAALDYAHEERVIHRDLKPANLMLDGRGRLKLADFGIAAVASDSLSRVSVRRPTSGTLGYMSPQQLAGQGPRTTDDIYALGATLYELLTSRPPFYTGDLAYQVREVAPQPLGERLADLELANPIPADVAALVMACLAKDPASRPQSARAVAAWIGLHTGPELASPEPDQRRPLGHTEPPTPCPPPSPPPHTEAVTLPGEAAPPERQPSAPNLPALLPSEALKLLVVCVCLAVDLGLAKSKPGTDPVVFRARLPAPPLSSGRWVNSLGMPFVAVPGTRAWFCVWETRVQDYRAFVRATGRNWPETDFRQTDAHPAVLVGWEDANAFCRWLTEAERRKGALRSDQAYRLPTDAEWSRAVGLPEEGGLTPQQRDAKVRNLYPWGSQWPPPRGAGNYADVTTRRAYNSWPVIEGYDDGYAETAPVASFDPNRWGLYDLGGNVWEWCSDWYDAERTHRVLRGAAWNCNDADTLLSAYRDYYTPDTQDDRIGFRVVLGPQVLSPL